MAERNAARTLHGTRMSSCVVASTPPGHCTERGCPPVSWPQYRQDTARHEDVLLCRGLNTARTLHGTRMSSCVVALTPPGHCTARRCPPVSWPQHSQDTARHEDVLLFLEDVLCLNEHETSHQVTFVFSIKPKFLRHKIWFDLVKI